MLDKVFSFKAGGIVLAGLIVGLTIALWASKGGAVYLEMLAAGFAACF